MTITEYLLALLAELHLPRQARRRILAEVEDHLICATAELHAEGLGAEAAEHEAVRRFGAPGELAHSFLGAHAARSGVRLANGTLILAALVAWVSSPAQAAGSVAFPLALLWFVLAQIVVVAAGLTWVRAATARRAGTLEADGLALVVRGTWVVIGCAAASAGILLGRELLPGITLSSAEGAGLLGMGVLASGCALAAVNCRRLVVRPGPGEEPRQLNEPDVVLAAADHVSAWLRSRVPRLARWLTLRAHPWRFALVVAGGAGVSLAAVHGISEGAPSAHHLAGGLLAGAIIASIEAAATLLGFAVLGRPLGLRPASPR